MVRESSSVRPGAGWDGSSVRMGQSEREGAGSERQRGAGRAWIVREGRAGAERQGAGSGRVGGSGGRLGSPDGLPRVEGHDGRREGGQDDEARPEELIKSLAHKGAPGTGAQTGAGGAKHSGDRPAFSGAHRSPTETGTEPALFTHHGWTL